MPPLTKGNILFGYTFLATVFDNIFISSAFLQLPEIFGGNLTILISITGAHIAICRWGRWILPFSTSADIDSQSLYIPYQICFCRS